METKQDERTLEYQYAPCLDADEMLAQVWDEILALLIEDAQKELAADIQGETC